MKLFRGKLQLAAALGADPVDPTPDRPDRSSAGRCSISDRTEIRHRIPAHVVLSCFSIFAAARRMSQAGAGKRPR